MAATLIGGITQNYRPGRAGPHAEYLVIRYGPRQARISERPGRFLDKAVIWAYFCGKLCGLQ